MKKKQKEVTQKHQKSEGGVSFVTGVSDNNKNNDKNNDFEKSKGNKNSFSDDSDLASLAREFEEEELVKESPFIRKVKIFLRLFLFLLFYHFTIYKT